MAEWRVSLTKTILRSLQTGLVLIFFWGLAPLQAAQTDTATSCLNKDLYQVPDSPLFKIPNYNQQSTETCWAHTATLLINYFRTQHGIGKKYWINPIYAAWLDKMLNDHGEKDATLNGDHVYKAIFALKNHGYCRNTDVERSLAEFKKDAQVTSDAELVQALNHLEESNRLTDSGEGLLSWLFGSSSPVCTDRYTPLIKDLGKIAALDISVTEILTKIFSKYCPNWLNFNLNDIPWPNVNDLADANSLQITIDSALQENTPSGVSFCGNVFDRSDFYGVAIYPDQHRRQPYRECKQHAAVIVGSRMVNGQCSYLVRNSWGPDWKSNRKLPCACLDSAGKYHPVCTDSDKPREYLGCWFPRNNFIANTFEVVNLPAHPKKE